MDQKSPAPVLRGGGTARQVSLLSHRMAQKPILQWLLLNGSGSNYMRCGCPTEPGSNAPPRPRSIPPRISKAEENYRSWRKRRRLPVASSPACPSAGSGHRMLGDHLLGSEKSFNALLATGILTD